MLDSVLGIRADEHVTVWMSHCRSLMKSSDGVQMLEKAHMESEDTFDLKVIRPGPSYAPTHAARRHEENCLSN